MFARKVHDLRNLGLGYLVRINATFADPVVMHMQHNSCGGFMILAEEALQHVHNKLHWRVVIIENEDAVHVWPLCLRLGLRNDRRAGPTLLVPLFAVIVGHAWRVTGRPRRAVGMIVFDQALHSGAETVESWMLHPRHNRDPRAAIPSRQFA